MKADLRNSPLSSITKGLTRLSGADAGIIERIPEVDRKPYIQIGLLNMVIAIGCALACFGIFVLWFNTSVILAIILSYLLCGGQVFLLLITSRGIINKAFVESKVIFFLVGIFSSLIIGFAVLLSVSNTKRISNAQKNEKTYQSLIYYLTKIKEQRYDDDSVQHDRPLPDKSSDIYIISKQEYNDYVDKIFAHYKNFLSLASSKYASLAVQDSVEISEKINSLEGIVIKRYYRTLSDGPDTSNMAGKVIMQARYLHSLPISEFTEIAEYFNPKLFETLSPGARLWTIVYFTGTVIILTSIAIAFLVFGIFLLIYYIAKRQRADFYHQILLEREQLNTESLIKQRQKITEDFRFQSEIRNTKMSLESLDEASAEGDVRKILDGLKDEYSPKALMTLAEFNMRQGGYEKGLEYINKAIDMDDELFSNNKDYQLHSEFYDIKARILNLMEKGTEAKVALDRYVELNDEKKFISNLSREILIERLYLENMPFYGTFEWNFKPGINILLGKNGYGKSHLIGLQLALLYEDKNKIREWIPPTSSAGTRAKLYIVSDHPVDPNAIAVLNQKLNDLRLKYKTIQERLPSLTGLSKEAEALNNAEPGKYQHNSPNGSQNLENELSQVKTEIMEVSEAIDREKTRIVATKDGISGAIGKVPILAIPDSRFIDKSESTFNNNKSSSEDLKRDGATEFLYNKSFAELIKKGLFITAQNNSTDFSKEPYSLIERVISNLADRKQVGIEPPDSSMRTPFFKFVRVESTNTTGDYKFYVKSEDSNEEFPLQKISQGTFSILAICLMIYRFLAELRPGSRNVLLEKAIVFIDEIDAHLHPSWEQKIIGMLRKEFPNVQFIITGHSPLIVAGCYEGEVSVLRHTKAGFHLEQSTEDFIGYTTPELFKKVFEIEDKDEQYLHYSALAEQEEVFKTKLEAYENKNTNQRLNENEIKDMDELSRKLNHINAVKKIKLKTTQSSISETENLSLKAEVEFLRDKIKNEKSSLAK